MSLEIDTEMYFQVSVDVIKRREGCGRGGGVKDGRRKLEEDMSDMRMDAHENGCTVE